MLKVIALFIPAIALLYFFLGRPAADPEGTAALVAESLVKLASLPAEVKESSGIVFLAKDKTYVTHNDAGNKPYLYIINEKGKLLQTIKLKLPNADWEDLAQDDDGNIYIADTGNNDNSRKQLAIYKLDIDQPEKIDAIRFTYEDQKQYPPAKKDRNFDVEAIFWNGGKLYLVSKDRGRGETAKVYELPDTKGQYKAKLVGQHKLGVPVTGAASSPSGQQVALVSEGVLHLFRNVKEPATFYEGNYQKASIKAAGQTEAVAFEDEKTLIITSENGGLYRYKFK
ncbi:hypothetical protein [Pontibacter sp. HJ8]